MRLLYREGGELHFKQRVNEPYAILSHTWGAESEEVTYQDIKDGRIKAGSFKIDFCLREAAQRGLKYVWIDTCCIDKRNISEVGEAINQMFRYYSEAVVCLVYLVDVQDANRIGASKWLTRGWTLQEMLAAPKLQFFSTEGYLGDETLVQRKPLSAYSLIERYRLSLDRKTSKPEDMSYCLVGLLEVSLLPNYGEGAEQARERLFAAVKEEHGKKISRPMEVLSYGQNIVEHLTPEILMDSLSFRTMNSRRVDISEPYAETCEWLVTHPDYCKWIAMSDHRFLWIKGNPGSGKSVLTKFVHARAPAGSISYFFNARGQVLDKSTRGLYSSLVFQLLAGRPHQQALIVKEFESVWTPEHIWSISESQHIFSKLVDGLQAPLQCYIDALDECREGEVASMVRQFEMLTARKSFLYIFLASRYYPAISIRGACELRLDLQAPHASALVAYVNGTLDTVDLSAEQAQDLTIQIIAKARGIFLWAVLVIQLVNQELSNGRYYNVKTQLQALPESLIDLFMLVVQGLEDLAQFRAAVQLLLFSIAPLKAKEFYSAIISALSIAGELSDAQLHEALSAAPAQLARFVSSSSRGLAAISSSQTVEFIHESVKDFFMDHCGVQRLWPGRQNGDVSWAHEDLKTICYHYLKTSPTPPPWTGYFRRYTLRHAEEAASSFDQREWISGLNPFLFDVDFSRMNLYAWPASEALQRIARLASPDLLSRREVQYDSVGRPSPSPSATERGTMVAHLLIRHDLVLLLRTALGMGYCPERGSLTLACKSDSIMSFEVLLDNGVRVEPDLFYRTFHSRIYHDVERREAFYRLLSRHGVSIHVSDSKDPGPAVVGDRSGVIAYDNERYAARARYR